MNLLLLTAKPIHLVFARMIAFRLQESATTCVIQASRREDFNALAGRTTGFEQVHTFHTPHYGIRGDHRHADPDDPVLKEIERCIDTINPDVFITFSISKLLNQQVAAHCRRMGAWITFIEASNSIYETLRPSLVKTLTRTLGIGRQPLMPDRCLVRSPALLPGWFREKCSCTNLPSGLFDRTIARDLVEAWQADRERLVPKQAVNRPTVLFLGTAPGRKDIEGAITEEIRAFNELTGICRRYDLETVLKPHPRVEVSMYNALPEEGLYTDNTLPGELLPAVIEVAGVVTIDSSAAENMNFFYGIPAGYVGLYGDKASRGTRRAIEGANEMETFIRELKETGAITGAESLDEIELMAAIGPQ
jgi:hypothetical protein